MNNIFKLREENPSKLRHVSEFSRPMINSVYHGTESISFLGPKIWDMLPEKLKNIETLEVFKKEIKIWKPDNCPCRLCKVFIKGDFHVHFNIQTFRYYDMTFYPLFLRFSIIFFMFNRLFYLGC